MNAIYIWTDGISNCAFLKREEAEECMMDELQGEVLELDLDEFKTKSRVTINVISDFEEMEERMLEKEIEEENQRREEIKSSPTMTHTEKVAAVMSVPKIEFKRATPAGVAPGSKTQ